jgi:methylglyoxal reductase
MTIMKIGKSGIKTPRISMGTWAIGGGTWWGDNDDSESIYAIHCAIENGIRWIDTAPVYGLGHSEEVVGKAIKGRRNQVILSTKCGLNWESTKGTYHKIIDNTAIYRDLSAKGIRRDVEESLKRLGTDYIDILYTHWQSEEPEHIPIEETMGELMKMKEEGKISAIGASNVNIAHIGEYMKFGQLDVIQEKYSILDRKAEMLMLPFCETYNISVQAYSPLEQGLLTGKVSTETKLRAGDVRNNNIWWQLANRGLVTSMLNSWKPIADKYNCTIGDLVIAWTVKRSKNINVLCGARKAEQVRENVKAEFIGLKESDYDRMTKEADNLLKRSKC